MKKLSLTLSLFAVGAATSQGCSVQRLPDGLRATPDGPGAKVHFDLSARPLPDIPVPNDLATFADPTSRTGRRINASLVAASEFERNARQGFSEMEGWGTFQPIWVQFDKPEGADPTHAAVDLDNVRARMQGDGYKFDDDPIYLVNLTTGVPMVLDMGNGNFPVTVRDPDKYWPSDPHVASNNLLFEDHEEGPGLTQADYRPELDTDFDGVLDHPNTLGAAAKFPGIDNLMNWYERETDSLILRPILPLDEKTEYAVVLTDRLKGSDGNPVKSPFPAIHHPAQRAGISRLAAVLGDSSAKARAYYGDLAGTGLRHVAFSWTYTTQPTIEDMILLRNGLYGKGPFARFATQFPAKLTALRAAGNVPEKDLPPGWDTAPPAGKCAERAKHPYSVYVNDPDISLSFQKLFKDAFGYGSGDVAGLVRDQAFIDHITVAKFESPYLQGDPNANDPDARFHLNFSTGEGVVHSDTVSVWIVVPKESAAHKQPFPITLWGHGVGGNMPEVEAYGGAFARGGLASVGVNMPQQGLPDVPSLRIPASAELGGDCLLPWTDAILTTRAKDRNGMGSQLPGWWWWTMHIANVRDNVRQGTLDEMQLTRILRTFDGHTMSGQDYNADGKEDLAGDFDGNGVPDVGGPTVGIYAAGESLGGMMSQIQGGIDHQLNGTAPMSGGGGLADIGSRSYGVTESLAQLMTPLIVSIPATDRPSKVAGGVTVLRTNCSVSQMSVRMLTEDGGDVPEVEIACLDAGEDALGMTVVATNMSTGEKACTRTVAGGRFRVAVAASKADRLDVQFYNGADMIDSYRACNVKPDAVAGRDIRTFEQKAPTLVQPAAYDAARHTGSDNTCDSPSGCAQWTSDFYAVGSPLVSVQTGMGYSRQTPKFRRFWNLGQGVVDPGDPITFAPYYALRSLPDPDGNPTKPRGLLAINTVGDAFVPTSTGFAFARAAGVVPFFPPSAYALYPEYRDYVTPAALYEAYGGRTVNQVYIDAASIEGIARLSRFPAGAGCKANYDPSVNPSLCANSPSLDATSCAQALYDIDWLSEGRQRFEAQHPALPMRIGRIAEPLAGVASLDQVWAPRLRGVPMSPDATAWDASVRTLGLVNVYIVPKGQHTWDTPDVCRIWDHGTYGDLMIARFFTSGAKDPYYLSHPSSHECLVDYSCDFLK